MSGVLRTGGGPARLLVAMLGCHIACTACLLRKPSEESQELIELDYATYNPSTHRITLTPEGLKAARIIRDGS